MSTTDELRAMKREPKPRLGSVLANERGIVLPIALALLALAIVFGTTAFLITRTDIRIAGNYKWGEQALYIADSGTEEFRARIRPTATNRITDDAPTVATWKGLLGGTAENASNGGYNQWWASAQTALPYKVSVRHQTDSLGNILRWGDDNADGVPTRNTTTGEIIYVARSSASTGNANKTIEVEVANFPPWSGGGSALYTEEPTLLQSHSTYVSGLGGCDGQGGTSCGNNRCGDPVVAVQTTLGSGGITIKSNPIVVGADPIPPDSSGKSIGSAPHDLDIQGMVDAYKGFADFSYAKVSATDTGMNWGTPIPGATPQQATSCTSWNIVYYDTKNSAGQPTDIKLAGGTKGCGMLLVEGDLEINGGFSWYGVVLVTEGIKFAGGGEKNITGMVLSGGPTDADLSIQGDASILYCSEAINKTTLSRPALRLSWKEIM